VSLDPFANVFGNTRGSHSQRVKDLRGRMLQIDIQPQNPHSRERYLPTPKGQLLLVLLTRASERGHSGFPTIAFHLADARSAPANEISTIGTGTFLASTSADGFFPLTWERPCAHYLDLAAFTNISSWLRSQEDADALAR
jgi:hypothetical protein